MARGAVAIGGFTAAKGVAAFVAALILLPLGAVFLRAGGWPSLAAGDGQAVWFTIWQAAASAAVSCALAVPVARGLARRRFAGRGAVIVLMGAPFLLPVIVAVMGLIAVFGRSGVVNQGLALLGLAPLSIYGVQGVLLAHVFLNLPLVVRMLLAGWQAIPAERFRLAQSLGMGPGAVARHLEWPMLRSVLPGAALVVFVVCLSSFAVALTLGGGPAATTVELAIYQAVLFDFDLGRAAAMATVQVALCIGAVTLAGRVSLPAGFGAGLDRVGVMPALPGWRRGVDTLWIALAALFLLVPLAAVLTRGLPGLVDLPGSVWAAAGRSLAVAGVSAALAVAGGLVLAQARAHSRLQWIGLAAMLPMAASGLVLGTGIFLLVHSVMRVQTLALPVTVLVNAALSLPFVYRLILPEMRSLQADYGRLQMALGIKGWTAFRLVTLPRLRRALGFAAGVAAALSMGDLGVNVLFAGESGATLPVVVSRLMGSYRTDLAAGAALLLVGLSFALFAVCDRWGRHAAS
jgi:thiamine transport system permease protein